MDPDLGSAYNKWGVGSAMHYEPKRVGVVWWPADIPWALHRTVRAYSRTDSASLSKRCPEDVGRQRIRAQKFGTVVNGRSRPPVSLQTPHAITNKSQANIIDPEKKNLLGAFWSNFFYWPIARSSIVAFDSTRWRLLPLKTD